MVAKLAQHKLTLGPLGWMLMRAVAAKGEASQQKMSFGLAATIQPKLRSGSET